MLLLYNPPSSAKRKPVLPMSLLALGAVLEPHHEYRIIDGNLEQDSLHTISQSVQETGADIIGVTVMPGPQLNHAVPLCRQLKTRFADLRIIWGGYFPTQHYDICLKSGYVDYVVRGYGEIAFKALVDSLKKGADPGEIGSIAYIHPEKGDIVATPPAEIPHPDQLPDFPYDRIDGEKYIRESFMGSRTISHHSSYGCPFSCHFCAVPGMSNGLWLAQSQERIAATVFSLVERFGVNAIEFYDNSFFIDEVRTADFAESIKHLHLGWWAEARIDTLVKYSEESWECLRDSGLRMVFMGAETGSDAILERMNKGGTASTEKTLHLAEKMKHYRIVPEFSFVLGNPPEPEEDVRRTIAFIRRIKQVNPDAEIIFYLYTPVPKDGTLFDQARAEGFQFPGSLEEWVGPEWQAFSQRRSTVNLPWMNKGLDKKIRNFECVLNAYYPTVTQPRLQGIWKKILRVGSAWRYHLHFYSFPMELRFLQKCIGYQRPETTGC